MATLRVRTNIQKSIMKYLQPQISDGYWEEFFSDKRLWDCQVVVNSDRPGTSWNVTGAKLDFVDILDFDFNRNNLLKYARQFNAEYNEQNLENDLTDLTEIVFGKQ